ncbi:CCC motif membrane protein [Gelidibacter mesophilus]|uniref:CCC motif membrane protein n=1 Tax=Gelidibacter mesophilus TaxID=169050 RepID=UPI000429A7EA|nr:CCC motif membrane protein [Gelidibacter mesophilus]
MEKQQLPNATLILVFGILSIVTCCCYGIIGLPLGIIAVVLANKATAVYAADPELYTGFQNVKTGRILAIIGIALNGIYLIYAIWLFSTIGYDGIQQMQEEIMRGFNEGNAQ